LALWEKEHTVKQLGNGNTGSGNISGSSGNPSNLPVTTTTPIITANPVNNPPGNPPGFLKKIFGTRKGRIITGISLATLLAGAAALYYFTGDKTPDKKAKADTEKTTPPKDSTGKKTDTTASILPPPIDPNDSTNVLNKAEDIFDEFDNADSNANGMDIVAFVNKAVKAFQASHVDVTPYADLPEGDATLLQGILDLSDAEKIQVFKLWLMEMKVENPDQYIEDSVIAADERTKIFANIGRNNMEAAKATAGSDSTDAKLWAAAYAEKLGVQDDPETVKNMAYLYMLLKHNSKFFQLLEATKAGGSVNNDKLEFNSLF
jgi:hypothetical protein